MKGGFNLDTLNSYDKFAEPLREALKSGIVAFPKGVQFEFTPFWAYRGIIRKSNQSLELGPDDFRSQMQRPNRRPGSRVVAMDCIGQYSCSLFTDLSQLKINFHLLGNNKRIAYGLVKDINGFQKTTPETTHVHWWLYHSACCEKDFKVIESE